MAAVTPGPGTVPGSVPTSVRAVRVLLIAGAVLTVLGAAGAFLVAGFDAETAGQVVWTAWPGVLGGFLARSLYQGGRRRFRLVILVCAFWLLGALGAIGNGQPQGVTGLILPIAILICLTRASSRDFFRS